MQTRAEETATQAPAVSAAAPLSLSSPAQVRQLQRAAGNRAVAALARTAAPPHPARRRLSSSSPAQALRLQRAAGNQAVAALARTAAPPQPVSQSEPTQEEIAQATSAVQIGTSTMMHSSCTDWCFTPLPLSGPGYADAWGILAHAFMSLDYEHVMGVTRGGDVYFDDSFAGPIDFGYGEFIHRKNPGNIIAPVFFAVTPVKRPDALLHDSTRTEFDEFKPDSIAGRLAGNVKLALIDGYMGLLGLPYHRGTSYTPTPSIPILTTRLRGIPIELSLSLRRDSAGLVVYEYCICTDWGLLTKAAVIALIILLMALILRGGIPVPVPVPV